jgi:hypothetical protein
MAMMTEDEVRTAVLKVDLLLKSKQSFWETPRNLALILTAVAAIAGLVGFKLANQPQHIVVQFEQPLAVKLLQDK